MVKARILKNYLVVFVLKSVFLEHNFLLKSVFFQQKSLEK